MKFYKLCKIVLSSVIILFIHSCTSSGTIANKINDIKSEVIREPELFVSPLKEIEKYNKKLQVLQEQLPKKQLLNNSKFIKYLELYETTTILESNQNELEKELRTSGEIELQEGGSYSFNLESFCIDSGKASPVSGDGFRLAKIQGDATKWLPEVLKKYSKLNISQEKAQNLVWGLLGDVKYDELDDDNKAVLLKIFPDAARRFGNKRLENKARSFFNDLLPTEVSELVEKVKETHSNFIGYQSDYKELVKVMAPSSNRKEPITFGWSKTEEGFYVKVTSKDSYSKIHIDIYMPISNESRKPASVKKIHFRPSEWVALPQEGQRLAISPNAVSKKYPKLEPCEELKKWKPNTCKEISEQDREKIIALSDPVNFPKTRYQSPPRENASIEEETDCSHFVKEIYKRAGFDFHYSPTKTFSCLNTFSEIKESEIQKGDIALFPSHIGVVGEGGDVISSTRGGTGNFSMLDSDDKNFKSSITINSSKVFRGAPKYFRWGCR